MPDPTAMIHDVNECYDCGKGISQVQSFEINIRRLNGSRLITPLCSGCYKKRVREEKKIKEQLLADTIQ